MSSWKFRYLWHLPFDLIVTLLVYHFFGFEVAVLLVLVNISVDVSELMRALYDAIYEKHAVQGDKPSEASEFITDDDISEKRTK